MIAFFDYTFLYLYERMLALCAGHKYLLKNVAPDSPTEYQYNINCSSILPVQHQAPDPIQTSSHALWKLSLNIVRTLPVWQVSSCSGDRYQLNEKQDRLHVARALTRALTVKGRTIDSCEDQTLTILPL